jgi:LPPG:FO 2-phospho-L-lactate transferase
MNLAGRQVLALAGGVGGAKLAAGLAHLVGERLTVLVNTGDDFEHLGLHISPDLDTVMYTLAGLANPQTGWGLTGETWTFMEQVEKLGGPTWFRLGDRDLATHALRTQRLRDGHTLTTATAQLCRAFGVSAAVLPMTDDRVRTIVHSQQEQLAFQDYFVRLQCSVPVAGLSFEGAAEARFNPLLRSLAHGAEGFVVVVCPSNPYLSIDPILALPGLRDWLKNNAAAIVSVSPIVGGAAVKGPAAKIMRELGIDPSAQSVAAHYCGLIDGFVIDRVDAASADAIAGSGVAVRVAQTIMRGIDERVALARECLAFAAELAGPAVSRRPA